MRERQRKTEVSTNRKTQPNIPAIPVDNTNRNRIVTGGLLGGAAVIAGGAVVFGLSKNNEVNIAQATSNFLKSRTLQVINVNVPVTLTPDLKQTNDYLSNLLLSATPKKDVAQVSTLTIVPPTIMPTTTLIQAGIVNTTEDLSAILPQELPLNTYRLNTMSQSEVWVNIVNGLIADYPKKGEMKGANSLLTTLANLPTKTNYSIAFQDFGPYPVSEPGLGHNQDDFKNYKDVYELVKHQEIKLSSLTRDNGDFYTSGIYGRADDRDAIAWFEAWTVLYWQNQERLKDTTIADIFNNDSYSDLRVQLVSLQNQTLARIQKRFLNLTQDEIQRRANKNGVDASAYLSPEYQKSNQYESCDVYEMNANKRTDQRQNIRLVTHMKGAKEVFRSADVDKEGILITISIDKKNVKNWGVRGITDRWYFDSNIYGKIPQENALQNAAGEQELPCGESVPVKLTVTAVPVRPQAQSQPGPKGPESTQPPAVYPTSGPTNVDRFTPGPTQPAPTNDIKPTDAG